MINFIRQPSCPENTIHACMYTSMYRFVHAIVCIAMYVPYSGKISRTINFTVFKDFTTASKINSSKSYL